MKMRTFLQNKMWRDLAVEQLEAQGSVVHWKRLDDAKYDEQLRLKLVEEAKEVIAAKSRQELSVELADLLEMIEAVCAAHGISMEEIENLRVKKRAERGGFEGRKYVTIAEHPEGSFGERYCLNDPDKYPEIEKPRP